MEDREFAVNQLSPKIKQGIAATLIIIRAGLCMQSGPICSEPPSSMRFTVPSLPTSSTQVRISTEPGSHLPVEMFVYEIKSKPKSEDQGSDSRSMESATTVTV